MKKDNNDTIQSSRSASTHRAPATDILVNPEVVRKNREQLGPRPVRRKRNYAKRILNDPFIFTA